MNPVQEIYFKLYESYGPQYWWPVTICGELKPTYNKDIIFSNKQRYEIALGAVLTQNTNWTNVEKAIINLNKNNMLLSEKILACSEDNLSEYIRPSGYFRLKAKRLKSMTKWWAENYPQILSCSKNVENMNYWRNSLIKVNGVGRETADSILLYSFDLPTFVIDTYTKRIMHRHLKTPLNISYEGLRSIFMEGLDLNTEIYKEFHALLVKNAKIACRKKECQKNCPLRK